MLLPNGLDLCAGAYTSVNYDVQQVTHSSPRLVFCANNASGCRNNGTLFPNWSRGPSGKELPVGSGLTRFAVSRFAQRGVDRAHASLIRFGRSLPAPSPDRADYRPATAPRAGLFRGSGAPVLRTRAGPDQALRPGPTVTPVRKDRPGSTAPRSRTGGGPPRGPLAKYSFRADPGLGCVRGPPSWCGCGA
jgi:hypothetical protein